MKGNKTLLTCEIAASCDGTDRGGGNGRSSGDNRLVCRASDERTDHGGGIGRPSGSGRLACSCATETNVLSAVDWSIWISEKRKLVPVARRFLRGSKSVLARASGGANATQVRSVENPAGSLRGIHPAGIVGTQPGDDNRRRVISDITEDS